MVFDNKVFISSSYRMGSTLIEILRDFTHKVLWTQRDVGLHFDTAIYRDGYLYAFDGRNEPDASLVCIDARTGGGEVARGAGVGGEDRRARDICGSLLFVDGQFLPLGEMGNL